MSVKLAGGLPDEPRSGMDLLHGQLVNHPQGRHVVIAVIDCAYTKVKHSEDGPTFTPTAGIRYIEPLLDRPTQDAVLEHLAAARAERLGRDELDLDFGVTDPVDNIFRDAAKRFADNGVTVTFGDDSNDDNN